MTSASPSRITVIVPARDEERVIGRCLSSIAAARAHLCAGLGADAPVVHTLVVLDTCTDATAHIAEDNDVATLALAAGSVGAARRTGIAHVLAAAAVPASSHWLANTDADSVVPLDWLTTHHRHAAEGAVVLTGLVRPDPTELTPAERARWDDLQPVRSRHEHVYGANLGIRADVYQFLGGFPAVRTGEDRALVGAALAGMIPVTATTSGTVTTSARTHSRAPSGFGAWLTENVITAGCDPVTARAALASESGIVPGTVA